MRRIIVIVAFAVVLAACSAASQGATPDAGTGTTPNAAAGSTTQPPTTAPSTTTSAAPSTTSTSPTTTVPSSTTTTTVPQETTTTAAIDAGAPVGTSEMVVDVDGVARTYRLSVPAQLDGSTPSALVIDLHGFTSNPDNHENLSAMAATGLAEGFVVAQPAGIGGVPIWDASADGTIGSNDVAFIRTVVNDVSKRVPIDADRVFASGFSNGGAMANRLACDASDVFAAIGTVAGAYVDADTCDPTFPVSVISFHGTGDFVVPFGGFRDVFVDIPGWSASWADRNGCISGPIRQDLFVDVYADAWTGCRDNAEVVLFTVIGGLHGWPGSPAPGLFPSTNDISATDTIWAFFESHSRG